MSTISIPEKCFITGEETIDHKYDDNLICYSVIFLKVKRSFRFNKSDWPEIMNEDTKKILKSFLLTNSWPIEEDTIITPGLLERLLRFDIYPKKFQEKLYFFLEFLYNKGGNEYKPQDFDLREHLIAFANDADEFKRIIMGLKSKDYLKFKEDVSDYPVVIENRKDFEKILLTENGINKVEEIIQERNRKFPPADLVNQNPALMLCGAKQDEVFFKKMEEFLLKSGFSVHPVKTDKKNAHGTVFNNRSTIYNTLQYFIFLKSENSDVDNAAGDLQAIAIERAFEYSSGNPPFQFFFTAFIDDSDYNARPRLQDFETFDARIIPIREMYINKIKADWFQRQKYSISKNKKKAEAEKQGFNNKEVREMNRKIDAVLEKLEKHGYGQEIIFEEIEELKYHITTLNKKNWSQILQGKLMDAVSKKIIDKTLATEIFNDLMSEIKKMLPEFF